MRLIQTRARTPSIELVEVGEEKLRSREIRYAILSHRWGSQEISFQDVNSKQQRQIEKTEGYRKIKQFCAKVAPEYEYAWVDTCCINKESSAEMSEAINSMYRWHQLAGICYAYLNDVAFCTDESQLHAEIE
ncbi:heterokaryon incompatibility protein-domain-containing protein [Aspergillus ambiguus]|uniref:heterokaryon incompatibility protein-domain-containing protein n=1 Tax=Aspergillus ambiguus TaxID=176160 RepID=UPI003CCCE9BC